MLCYFLISSGCHSFENAEKDPVVASAEESSTRVGELTRETLERMLQHPSTLLDSVRIKHAGLVKAVYAGSDYRLIWSSKGALHQEADSLLTLIDSAWYYGLLPEDYYAAPLKRVKQEWQLDTVAGNPMDVSRRAVYDILSTAAFIQLLKDLKVGRLVADSVWKKDTLLTAAFFTRQKQRLATLSLRAFTSALEPAIGDYHQLKAALRTFLPGADMKSYTLIKTKDSLLLPKLVYKRLREEDSLRLPAHKSPDSLAVAAAIKKYQKRKKLKVDGRLSAALVNRLNTTDREKFLRIAITLDKYKLLPALPQAYIWVNLPGYLLEIREGDSVVFTSKIICGKPATKTPQLTSAVTDMITYPQWTIPESIIKKEILPGLKRDAGYTKRKGYSIVDYNGNEINPYTVKWAKYKKGIPYKVIQGSGDANALGVIKFNFANPYAVYLHDTNQRYLFDRSSRALSHGCVRVQKWRELANYILRRDDLADSTKAVPIDSLHSWLDAKKKKVIRVQQPLPLFIRYLTCTARNGKLVFYEDIYEEDKRIRETVFAYR